MTSSYSSILGLCKFTVLMHDKNGTRISHNSNAGILGVVNEIVITKNRRIVFTKTYNEIEFHYLLNGFYIIKESLDIEECSDYLKNWEWVK